VRPYRSSRKSKPRTIPLGNVSFSAIWKYIAEADLRPDDYLFDLTPRGVQSIFSRVKARTGIPKVHVHRFRHTFATECIRANIDLFTVKCWLGHSTLDMVMRYVNFVKAYYEAAHRRGSPGDRMLKRKRL
jgi:integrase